MFKRVPARPPRRSLEALLLLGVQVSLDVGGGDPQVGCWLWETKVSPYRFPELTMVALPPPGHEAAFAAFLCCLCKIGVLRVDDQIAIVFKVFNR